MNIVSISFLKIWHTDNVQRLNFKQGVIKKWPQMQINETPELCLGLYGTAGDKNLNGKIVTRDRRRKS